MRTQSRISFPMLWRFGLVMAAGFLACNLALHAADEPAGQKKTTAEELSIGREIFLREWLPNDPRGHGGDGLGPVFNDTSCVACHNLGGAGGGGPASKNVDIITAAPANPAQLAAGVTDEGTPVAIVRFGESDFVVATMRFVNGFRLLTGAPLIPVALQPKSEQKINVSELAKLHPGFRTSRSIVVPRFGTEPEFEKWHPAHSNGVIAPLFGIDPPSMLDVPEAPKPIAEQTGLHPLFQTVVDFALRRMGVKVESEMMLPQRIGVNFESRTVTTIQSSPVKIIRSQLLVPRQVDEPAGLWKIAQAAAQSAEQVIDFVGLLFSANADFDAEPGLAQEALAIRSMRSMGSLSVRSEMLTMTMDDNSSPFGSAIKNANAQLVPSHRNPTALFGAGLIDRIPDAVIEQAALSKHRDFPTVKGRVSRLRDGRIGKFGWKGQTASLRDFTLTACAVELGLNVPGHEQAVVPYKPEYRSPGLDLTEKECDALVAYLASLPAPNRSRPANAEYTTYLNTGEKLFTETGCAACHTRKLGDVDGLYSDLLLHDMGPALADSGQYGTIPPDDPDEDEIEPAAELVAVSTGTNETQAAPANSTVSAGRKSRSPRRSEWRTPPLWGVRDSGPYLHDGGAETIQDAIAMHGGEALTSTNNYFKLPHEKRQQLIGFLKSLTAP